MGHGGDLVGKVVSKEYAAKELGFESPVQMDRFYALMKVVEPKVAESLKRWYGRADGQIVFEVASIGVMACLNADSGLKPE